MYLWPPNLSVHAFGATPVGLLGPIKIDPLLWFVAQWMGGIVKLWARAQEGEARQLVPMSA